MDLKEKIAAVSTFGIATAASYLFGYWGAFNVNVLELGSLIDVAKLAAFPLLASLAFFMTGTVTTEILQGDRLPPGGGNDTPIGRWGLRYWRLLVIALISSIVLISIYGPEPGNWFLASLLTSFLSIPICHSELAIKYIPNPKIRSKALYLAILLPTISFAYGRLDAHLVKTGHPNRIIDVARSKLELRETNKRRVAYLGRIGEVDVLYESLSGTIVLSKQRDENPLFIIPLYEPTLQREIDSPAPVTQPKGPPSATTNASVPTSAKKL